jgi:hypothetical protein
MTQAARESTCSIQRQAGIIRIPQYLEEELGLHRFL